MISCIRCTSSVGGSARQRPIAVARRMTRTARNHRHHHLYHPKCRQQSTTARTGRRKATTLAPVNNNNNNSNGQRPRQGIFMRILDRLVGGSSSNGGVRHGRFRSTSLEEILRKPRTVPIPRWITPKHQTITLSEVLGHSSFILVAISYAVDDFLLLRCIAVAGSTAMLFFTYFHPHGRILWLPFKWNALFIALNSYRIGKVYLDRYFAEQLSDYWINFRDKNFYLMDPADFSKLVNAGTVKEYREGDLIFAQGEDNPYVALVLDGVLKVFHDGKLAYILEEANFMSEAGLHAGLMLPGRIESCCSVVADSPATILLWDRTELISLMHRTSGVRRSLKAILSWDIVRKLKAQRDLLAEGLIGDEKPEEWTARSGRQTQHRYTAILYNVLCHPELLDERRKQLNKYRMIHHIDDEAHEKALNRIGWTLDEYEAGHKFDNDPRWDVNGHHHRDDGSLLPLPTNRVVSRYRTRLRATYLRVTGASKDF